MNLVKIINDNRGKDIVEYSSVASMEIYLILGNLYENIEISILDNIFEDDKSINVVITTRNADYHSLSYLRYLSLQGYLQKPKVYGLPVDKLYSLASSHPNMNGFNPDATLKKQIIDDNNVYNLTRLILYYSGNSVDCLYQNLLKISSDVQIKNTISYKLCVDNDFNSITHRIIYASDDYKQLIKRWDAEHKKNIEKLIEKGLSSPKWKNEYYLFLLIKTAYHDTVFQYRNSEVFGKQSVDIFIPSEKIAIEYQGKQHYEAVDYFGGNKQLIEQKNRDELKKRKCTENGLKLFEWNYQNEINVHSVNCFLNSLGLNKRVDVDSLNNNSFYIRNSSCVNEKSVIAQYDNNGLLVDVYKTIKDASISTNTDYKHLQKSLNSGKSSKNGWCWKKYLVSDGIPEVIEVIPSNCDSIVNKEDVIKKLDITNISFQNRDMIIQFSEEKVEGLYKNMTHASKSTGVDYTGIKRCVSGEQKTSGGFFWARTNDILRDYIE